MTQLRGQSYECLLDADAGDEGGGGSRKFNRHFLPLSSTQNITH